jgi:hypothetical protein
VVILAGSACRTTICEVISDRSLPGTLPAADTWGAKQTSAEHRRQRRPNILLSIHVNAGGHRQDDDWRAGAFSAKEQGRAVTLTLPDQHRVVDQLPTSNVPVFR